MAARKTFRQLQKDVARYVQGDDSDTELLGIAGSGINAGIDQLNMYDWCSETTTSGFGFVADQRDYNAPTDAIAFTELSLLGSDGNIRGRLRYRLPEVFERLHNPAYGDIPNGFPTEYTIYGERSTQPTMRLSATPTSSFVATNPSGEYRYSQEIAQLSGVSETMSVSREMEQAVTWFAKSYVAAVYDPDKVQYAEARYQDLLDKQMIAKRDRKLRNF